MVSESNNDFDDTYQLSRDMSFMMWKGIHKLFSYSVTYKKFNEQNILSF